MPRGVAPVRPPPAPAEARPVPALDSDSDPTVPAALGLRPHGEQGLLRQRLPRLAGPVQSSRDAMTGLACKREVIPSIDSMDDAAVLGSGYV